MPGGACARRSAEQTSVPAITSCSAAGVPRLTTCSGSRSLTLSTVYCQVPAHSGPIGTVGVMPAASIPRARTSAITCAAVGCPAQVTATWSPVPVPVPVSAGTGTAGGGGTATAGGGASSSGEGGSAGAADGDACGAALGGCTFDGTGVQPATAPHRT